MISSKSPREALILLLKSNGITIWLIFSEGRKDNLTPRVSIPWITAGVVKLSILIKRHQLAKEIENARPSRFARGDKIDAMIIDLDKVLYNQARSQL